MAGRLSGKVCIITGSGGSMGRAAAILFASEGARVIGCDVNVESAIETMRLVKAARGDMVSLQPCDLTDAKQCQALVEFAVSTYDDCGHRRQSSHAATTRAIKFLSQTLPGSA